MPPYSKRDRIIAHKGADLLVADHLDQIGNGPALAPLLLLILRHREQRLAFQCFELVDQATEAEGRALLAAHDGCNLSLVFNRVAADEKLDAFGEVVGRACGQLGIGKICEPKRPSALLCGLVSQPRLGRLSIAHSAPVRLELNVELLDHIPGTNGARIVRDGYSGVHADKAAAVEHGEIPGNAADQVPNAIALVRGGYACFSQPGRTWPLGGQANKGMS